MLYRILAALALSGIATAQITVTSISNAQATRAAEDIIAYQASLAAQPEYTSVYSVLATALPSSLLADPNALYSELATATALPPWFTGLPSDVQSYIASVGQVEASIINKDASSPAPTGRAVQAGGLMAMAGAVVVALL